MYPSLSNLKEHRIEGLFYTHVTTLVYDLFERKQYKTEVERSYSTVWKSFWRQMNRDPLRVLNVNYIFQLVKSLVVV